MQKTRVPGRLENPADPQSLDDSNGLGLVAGKQLRGADSGRQGSSTGLVPMESASSKINRKISTSPSLAALRSIDTNCSK